ncbi:MAG: TlpA family protein disulfide reductase, partial [Nitrosospira sp.]
MSSQLECVSKMQRALVILFCLLLALPSGAQAKGFVFTDSTGKKLTLSDYKGKWVLINFWATWCPP